MNKGQLKGIIDEVAGNAKRRAGELTGNTQLQVEGMVQQVKGKAEHVWGNAKVVVDDANQEAAIEHKSRIEVEVQRAAVEDASAKNK
ncbi:MAG: CsbD family protein [Terracidiphilus sp.]